MHEGVVCSEILDISLKAAKENDIKKITAITVVVGKNSCIHNEELQFYFQFARKETIASDAVLIIEKDEQLMDYRSEYVKSIEGD